METWKGQAIKRSIVFVESYQRSSIGRLTYHAVRNDKYIVESIITQIYPVGFAFWICLPRNKIDSNRVQL